MGVTLQERALGIAVPVIAILALWQVGALLVGNPALLPAPTGVLSQTYLASVNPGPDGRTALFHLRASLVRVVIVLVISMVLATALGILMGVDERVERLFSTWLPFWMTMPTVVVVLVSMVAFNFSQLSIIVAVLFASTPFAALNTWKGAQSVDPHLVEMARTYKVDTLGLWRHIYVPHLMPYIFGSFRYLFGMVWKIVAVAEVFGMSTGLGAMFRFFYTLGETTNLLAYALLFLFVILIVEYVILDSLERRVFAWRETPTGST